jgi:hypothetical protein
MVQEKKMRQHSIGLNIAIFDLWRSNLDSRYSQYSNLFNMPAQTPVVFEIRCELQERSQITQQSSHLQFCGLPGRPGITPSAQVGHNLSVYNNWHAAFFSVSLEPDSTHSL